MQATLAGLKKIFIIYQLVAVLGCNQGQVLASVGSQSNVKPAVAPQLKTMLAESLNLDDPNQDSDLWVNITHEDFADEASQLAIVAKNNSQYDLKIIACDQRPYLNNKLSSIPAGFQFPLTRNYDSRWRFLDPAYNGLFDGSLIGSNSLFFSGTPAQDQFSCYYRIFVPEANAWLYLKLVNNLYRASSYSPDGQAVLTRPHADKLLAAQSNLWFEISSATIMDILFGAASYKYLVKSFPTFNPAYELQKKIEAAIAEWLDEVNQTLWFYRDAINYPDGNPNADSYRQALNEMLSTNAGGNRYLKINDAEKFYSEIRSKGELHIGRIGFDRNSQQFFYEYQNRGNTYQRKVIVNNESPLIRGDPLPNPAREIERLGLRDDPEVFLKLFARGKYANINSVFRDIGDLEKMGFNVDEVVSFGAANTAIDLVSLGISGVTTVAFIFVQYFLLQPLLNGWFDQPAVGTFSTGINHLRLEQITPSEVNTWNATHDKQHQIADTSRLTIIGKSSLYQNAIVSFKDPGIDSQLAVYVTLSALTTPWVRYAAYDPLGDNPDPYLGCVDKNGRCLDGTVTHKADAVVAMQISDNKPQPSKDLDNSHRLAIYREAGLSSLGSDRMLEAPILSDASGTAIKRLILSDRQMLNLSTRLSLPTDRQAMPANKLYGGGLAVRLVEISLESAASSYLLVKSDQAAELLLRDVNAKKILLAKFNCPFPLAVGQSCPLQLGVLGSNDGHRQRGQLLIADQNSATLALALYINYKLIGEPEQFTAQQGDSNNHYTIRLTNGGSESYTAFAINGLPLATRELKNSCLSGLSSMDSCEIDYDFAKVAKPGNYKVVIRGQIKQNESQPNSADQVVIQINIIPGF